MPLQPTDPSWNFYWVPFNHAFGPWFRLRALRRDGTSTDLEVGGRACEALVQPDMDRERWYWSVRFAAYTPKLAKADKPTKGKAKVALKELKFGAKVDTEAQAKAAAIECILAGRPDVTGPQRVVATQPPPARGPQEVT